MVTSDANVQVSRDVWIRVPRVSPLDPVATCGSKSDDRYQPFEYTVKRTSFDAWVGVSRRRYLTEYLLGHAYHTYRLTSPDNTVSFEFQHNVCGRSIYAEGTVDAALFLRGKADSATDDKTVYDMIDVLREGGMVTNIAEK